MYTIVLDSSNKDLLVGIAYEDKIIDCVNYEAWQRQSELMIPELERLMKKNSVNKDNIKDVVIGIGPGSYTGVRISLTIGKIISQVLNVPLYAISSLQMLKCGEKLSICLINARSKRSYVGVYQGDKTLLKDCIMYNDDIKSLLLEYPDAMICGDTSYLGLDGYQGNIMEEMLSIKKNSSSVDNVLGLTPIYLKD